MPIPASVILIPPRREKNPRGRRTSVLSLGSFARLRMTTVGCVLTLTISTSASAVQRRGIKLLPRNVKTLPSSTRPDPRPAGTRALHPETTQSEKARVVPSEVRTPRRRSAGASKPTPEPIRRRALCSAAGRRSIRVQIRTAPGRLVD